MRMRIVAAGALALAAVLSAATPADAQNSRWADPYRNGVKAFEAGKCAEAVPLLERAVSVDARASSQKFVEGVFRIDYFPYYYLAICYAEAQQWDKAAANLDKAKATQTRQQQAKLAETEGKIKGAAPANAANNAGNTTGGNRGDDARKRAFDAAVATAESSLSNKQFQAAVRQFDGIKSSYAAEYASAGLSAKRDEAARGYGVQLADEGRQLASNQKYSDAKQKFQQAEQASPGLKQAADGLADIKKREDDYQQLKAAAQADQNAKNYSSARDKLEQARSRHAELFAADNLSARITELQTLASSGGGAGRGNAGNTGATGGNTGNTGSTGGTGGTGAVDQRAQQAQQIQQLTKSAKDYISQGRYADADTSYNAVLKLDPNNREAKDAVDRSKKFTQARDTGNRLTRSKKNADAAQAFTDARGIDPERFTREKLGPILESLLRSTNTDKESVPPPPDPSRLALQQGLQALLNGRAQDAVTALEPAASNAAKAASLHAYLGVAYATQALSATNPEDRSRLQDKAVEQFKLAKTAQGDYQLSTRVVSPAIVSIYQNAKP